MSGFDDRKKALEEEYFRRKEQEAIEKLRAQRAADEAATAEMASTLPCPKCDGRLKEISYEGVQIDRCTKCNGIWLDAGELDRLGEKEDEGGFFGRMWKSFSG
jgi:Zn-finger nucleic acid-binding protein